MGWLSLLLGLLILIPGAIAYGYAEGVNREVVAFLVTAAVAMIIGFTLKRKFRISEGETVGVSEGFASVTFSWLLLTFFGALPFWISGVCPNLIDAFFESMSGFSTTGATVIEDIEATCLQAPGVMFWRSFTHWLGGMGIVALSVAVLPALRAGGSMLFKAEITGPTKDRLFPRIADTAKILWFIYLGLTLAEAGLLWLLGMPLYDSFCHAFGTMATGGFSTKNASIGYYESSAAIHWVIILFMFLAGVNFVLHFQMLRGNARAVLANRELWVYVGLLVLAMVVMTLVLYLSDEDDFLPGKDGNSGEVDSYASFEKSFRDSTFQAVSITTTTGYCTADFNCWPNVCRYLLVLLMFGGACAGSTGGGIKLVRIMIAVKAGIRELRRLARSSAVFTLKIGEKTVSREIISNTLGFFVLYFLAFIICSIVMSWMDYDFETAFTSVLACLSNIGPGLGDVGAVENYAHIPSLGKLMLSFCMLMGRLEIYAVLTLFIPLTWKK